MNVNAEAERTRVRVSMVAKVRDDKGATRRVTTIDDPLAYQKILGALDKAVYLQKEGL